MTTIVWPVLQGPDVGIPGAMGARVVDGLVEYIELYTRGARVQELAFDQLLAKFGQPRSTSMRPLQTRMGVKVDSIDADWLYGSVTVVLQGITSSIEQGQIVVATERGIAAQKAAIEAIAGPRPKM